MGKREYKFYMLFYALYPCLLSNWTRNHSI